MKSFMAVPVAAGARVLGALTVASPRAGAFGAWSWEPTLGMAAAALLPHLLNPQVGGGAAGSMRREGRRAAGRLWWQPVADVQTATGSQISNLRVYTLGEALLQHLHAHSVACALTLRFKRARRQLSDLCNLLVKVGAEHDAVRATSTLIQVRPCCAARACAVHGSLRMQETGGRMARAWTHARVGMRT